MYYRVFGTTEAQVAPSQLVEYLHAQGLPVEPHFKGDDLGWTRGELILPGGHSPIMLERYLTDEDDIRDDLNAFAALVETYTYSPNATLLMERIITTQQLIVFRRPIDHANESRLDATLQATVQFLAQQTEGVYQIDGAGWYSADGAILITEY